MYYTIYKITNNINGKFYIGKHQTKDLNDGYMGSGKLLKRSIQKYGIENFTKEYIEILDSEQKMNLAEKIYVIIDNEVSYNLCSGGHGGFGYINQFLPRAMLGKHQTDNQKQKAKEYILTHSFKYKSFPFRKKISDLKKGKKTGQENHFFGKQHSEETKIKIALWSRNNQQGSKNSQYGTCWITNGQENKKIKKEELDSWLEKGYFKGRITQSRPNGEALS